MKIIVVVWKGLKNTESVGAAHTSACCVVLWAYKLKERVHFIFFWGGEGYD